MPQDGSPEMHGRLASWLGIRPHANSKHEAIDVVGLSLVVDPAPRLVSMACYSGSPTWRSAYSRIALAQQTLSTPWPTAKATRNDKEIGLVDPFATAWTLHCDVLEPTDLGAVHRLLTTPEYTELDQHRQAGALHARC